MNFISALNELDKLYESVDLVEDTDEAADIEIDEDDVEEVDVEIEDDEEVEEEVAKTAVIECNKCGGITLKDKKDLVADEETGLVNVGDACQYCEAEEGFKVLGNFVPAEVEVKEEADEEDEVVEESLTEGKIADSIKKVATRLGADGATVMRSFAELVSEVLPEKAGDALYDAASYVENKAALKALMSGNEKLLNDLTVEDIEDLKQDLEDYKNKKDEDLEEGLFGNKNKVDAEEIIGKYLPGMSDAQEIFNEVSYEIGSVLGNMIEKAKRETKKNSGMYATYKPLHDLIMDGRITKLIKKSDFLTPLRSIINTLEAVDGDAKLGKLKQYAEKIAELAKDKAAAGIMKELNKLSQKFLDGTLYDQKHALAWYDGAAV